MNILFDLVLFIVSLAVNSLQLGLVVTGGTAIAFQLIRKSYPRLRYTLAVAAFVIAAFVPVAVTLAGADEPQSPPITIDISGVKSVLRPATVSMQRYSVLGGDCCVGNFGLDLLMTAPAFTIDFSNMTLRLDR